MGQTGPQHSLVTLQPGLEDGCAGLDHSTHTSMRWNWVKTWLGHANKCETQEKEWMAVTMRTRTVGRAGRAEPTSRLGSGDTQAGLTDCPLIHEWTRKCASWMCIATKSASKYTWNMQDLRLGVGPVRNAGTSICCNSSHWWAWELGGWMVLARQVVASSSSSVSWTVGLIGWSFNAHLYVQGLNGMWDSLDYSSAHTGKNRNIR